MTKVNLPKAVKVAAAKLQAAQKRMKDLFDVVDVIGRVTSKYHDHEYDAKRDELRPRTGGSSGSTGTVELKKWPDVKPVWVDYTCARDGLEKACKAAGMSFVEAMTASSGYCKIDPDLFPTLRVVWTISPKKKFAATVAYANGTWHGTTRCADMLFNVGVDTKLGTGQMLLQAVCTRDYSSTKQHRAAAFLNGDCGTSDIKRPVNLSGPLTFPQDSSCEGTGTVTVKSSAPTPQGSSTLPHHHEPRNNTRLKTILQYITELNSDCCG